MRYGLIFLRLTNERLGRPPSERLRSQRGTKLSTRPRHRQRGSDGEPLGLSLGVITGFYHGRELEWLRWIDEHGRVLPHSGELGEALEAALERAAEAERKLAELQAKLARG